MKVLCCKRRSADSEAETMRSTSTPARAVRAASPSSYWATATSTDGASRAHRGVREGSRSSRRSDAPPSWRRAATAPPMRPVAPVTAMRAGAMGTAGVSEAAEAAGVLMDPAYWTAPRRPLPSPEENPGWVIPAELPQKRVASSTAPCQPQRSSPAAPEARGRTSQTVASRDLGLEVLQPFSRARARPRRLGLRGVRLLLTRSPFSRARPRGSRIGDVTSAHIVRAELT